MTNEIFYTLIVAVLSSSLLAAAFTSLATGLFSMYLKRKEYENDYFKEVVQRRLAAYEFIESQIAMLKSSVLDYDGRSYHLIFGMGRDQLAGFEQNLLLAISKGVWIGDETGDLLIELSRIFLTTDRGDESEEALKEAGKQRYLDIHEIRSRLEMSVRNDFLEIHKVQRFLKGKQRGTGFDLVDLRTGKTLQKNH